MSIVTFSNGETARSGRIRRVTIRRDVQRLEVQMHDDPPIRIQGPGVEADVTLLNDIRDKEGLPFLVHEILMSHADYLKLLEDYEKAVGEYTAAVRTLVATKGSTEFRRARTVANAAHAKSEELRKRLNAAKANRRKSN